MSILQRLPFPAREIAHTWAEDRNTMIPRMIRTALDMPEGNRIHFALRDLHFTEPVPGVLGHPFTWLEYTHLSLPDRILLRCEQAGLRAWPNGSGDVIICERPTPNLT